MLHSYDLTYADDYTVNNRKLTEIADIDAPIVFVGYGITAPEFGWNDYAGIDVKGKVVLFIVNEPPSDDPKFFGGKALTYYGRWTYKFEEAARQGAIGALIIHRTDLASYGWDVVQELQHQREDLPAATTTTRSSKPQAGFNSTIARTLFHAASLRPRHRDDCRGQAAASRPSRFPSARSPHRSQGPPLPVAQRRRHAARSITPTGQADQAVMYTAHYDHLGIDPGVKGDNIYNGAADNATGCGMLLELARAWAAIRHRAAALRHLRRRHRRRAGPARLASISVSIRPFPPSQIALDINYDMILPIGIPQEVNVNGAQRTTFYPPCRRPQSASTSPSSPTLTPRPATTTAPTTSRSRASAFPPSPSIRDTLRRPRSRLGRSRRQGLRRARLPQLLRQLSRRLGLHRQRETRPLRHGPRLAGDHRTND